MDQRQVKRHVAPTWSAPAAYVLSANNGIVEAMQQHVAAVKDVRRLYLALGLTAEGKRR